MGIVGTVTSSHDALSFPARGVGAISEREFLDLLDSAYPEELLFAQVQAHMRKRVSSPSSNRPHGHPRNHSAETNSPSFGRNSYQRIARRFAQDTEKSGNAKSNANSFSNTDRMQASPLVLTGNCLSRPICRHCKWEHFKTISENEFALDRPRETLIAQAHRLAECGIHRAFCATGWMGHRLPARFVETVEAIHAAEPRLDLYGLFGALDRQSHRDLARVGLAGMLTGIESPNETIYRGFRPGGDSLADRIHALAFAREEGLAVWTGFLVGLGESTRDIAEGIRILDAFEPESISLLPFVPYPHTPMADASPTDPAWLARVNAAARIALPHTRYFFSDRAAGFDEDEESRFGINAYYETCVGHSI